MFNISHSPPPYFFGSTPWPGANFSFSPSIETLDTFADWHALKSQQPAAQHFWYGAHAQRLREMPSGAHPQPSRWVRPEPKRQPKTHRGQDRPLQSHRQSQLQGAVVSDDTFHASAWEVAGNSGGLLYQTDEDLIAASLNASQQRLPVQPPFDAMAIEGADPRANNYHNLEKPAASPISSDWSPSVHPNIFTAFAQSGRHPSWPTPHPAIEEDITHTPPMVNGRYLPQIPASQQHSLVSFGAAFSSQQSLVETSFIPSATGSSPISTADSFSSSAPTDPFEQMALDPISDSWTMFPNPLPSQTSSVSVDLSGTLPAYSGQEFEPIPWQQQLSIHAPGSGVSPKLLRIHSSPVPSASASSESVVTAYMNDSRDAEAASFNPIAPGAAPLSSPSGKIAGGGYLSGKAAPQKSRTRLPDKPRSLLAGIPILRSHAAPSKLRPKTLGSETKGSNRKSSQRHRERSPSTSPSPDPPTTKRRQTKRIKPVADLMASGGSIDKNTGNSADYRPLPPIAKDIPPPPPPPLPPQALPSPSPTPSSSRKPTREPIPIPTARATKKSTPADSSDEDDIPCSGFAKLDDADRFLIKSREAGLTYKEIRVKGNYLEAESTLRGRYRTLTKRREERVRKPEWSATDLHLLAVAVRTLAVPATGPYSRNGTAKPGIVSDRELATAKVPWKRVAEYIVQNGGTYLFGNSTCRKKWDELREQQTREERKPRSMRARVSASEEVDV